MILMRIMQVYFARYKSFNNPQGNSPISSTSSEFSSAATLYPDQEDLNRDNTLNETEEYFQYIVDLEATYCTGNVDWCKLYCR